MKLQSRAAEDFVRAPDPRIRAVLVYGPDEGQVRERGEAIARRIVPDGGDPFRIAVLPLDGMGADPSRLADEAQALSMTGGRRLVVVRDATDKLAPACAVLAAAAPGADCLVVVEAGDLSPRSALRKLFEATADFAAIACYVDDERSLSGLIRDTLAQDRIMVEPDALAYLAQALSGDRALMRRALEKISLYLGPSAERRTLSYEDAFAAIGDAGALELDDPARAAAEGDRAATDRAVGRLLDEGTSPVAILRASQGYFRRLHLARAAMEGGQSAEAAMASLRPPVFFKEAPRFRRQVERWRAASLAAALNRLVECEAAVKRTGAPDTLLTARAMILIAQMSRGA